MANPTGSNIFKSWSINGTYDIQNSKTTSDAEITLVVNSDITATASFTQAAPYQVAYDVKNSVNKISMYATDRQGIYVSAKAIDIDTTFTIFDSSTKKYAYSEGKGAYWITSENPTPSILNWANNYADANKVINKYKVASM